MLIRVFLCVLTAAVMTLNAATSRYRVKLFEDSVVNGKQLKAGDYKVEMKDNSAVLKNGRQVVEIPAHTEPASSKFRATEVEYKDNNNIQEIHIGGTTTRIVFGNTGPSSNGTE